MSDQLKAIRERRSSRVLFNPKRKIPGNQLKQILEAATWAPTAHNMQNFEIVVVDDRKMLESIGGLKYQTSLTFIRENYKQLSFSEAELRKKKVGILGTQFPPAWLKPNPTLKDLGGDGRSSFISKQISSCSAFLVVLYDPKRRAPASEGDFLGAVSLGCMMENVWLMANSLGIAVHIVSSVAQDSVAKKIKGLLKIPGNLKIVFAFRLGYPLQPFKSLRVRREIGDFVSFTRYGKNGKI